MKTRRAGCIPVIMVMMCTACCCLAGASAAQEQAAASAADIRPPVIEHEPLADFPAGMPLRIQARVSDDSGVREVILFYRAQGAVQYQQMPMRRAPGSNLYAADLPAGLGPRIEYFIRASDTVGNSVLGNLFDPYLINVTGNVPGNVPGNATGNVAPPVVPNVASGIVSAEQAAVDAGPAPATAFDRAAAASGERGTRHWVWIGVGMLAVAALVSAGGGGGGGSAGAPPSAAPRDDTGAVTINAPLP